jgi:DNA replication protein DnaC
MERDLIKAFNTDDSFASRLYVTLFNKIPQEINYSTDLEPMKFIELVKKEFNNEIEDTNLREIVNDLDYKEINERDRIGGLILLKSGEMIIVFVRGRQIDLITYDLNTPTRNRIEKIIKEISAPRVENNGKLFLITNKHGLSLTKVDVKIDDKFDFEEIYNDEILQNQDKIDSFLTNDQTGLFLLYGKPGTGKTTFIKYVVKQHKEKTFIYIPNLLFQQLDAPALIEFFSEHPDSILILEDAEALLTAREEGNTTISTLLNLTDGMLGEALRIKVIATFNCEISKIDPALTRKGRLKGVFKFNELSIDKTNALIEKVNPLYVTESCMVLTEILNVDVDLNLETKPKNNIGFKA